MKRATSLVLLLFSLSGISGLIYEIIWIRQLSHLLGGTSYAISTVLAAFMGGLALGSRFYGRRADGHRRPLRLYAFLELGIAAFALAVYGVISLAPPAYVWLARLLPGSALSVMRVVIALLLLVPPTFLMGGTLPVLSRFVVRERERLGRGLGLLYGVNTFGAVLGSFLAGFVLVSGLGLAGSTAVAILLNLLISAGILLIDRRIAAQAPPAATAPAPAKAAGAARSEASKASGSTAAALPESSGEPEGADLDWRLLAAIFAMSGFASLGYELYWTKGLQHFLGNSTYAFSTMLTTFLLGLAMGGWLGGRLVDRVKAPARLLGWVQIGVGATVLLTVLLIWGWLPRLNENAYFNNPHMSWNTYLMRRFLAAAAIMVPPTFLTGMTFPVVNRIGISNLSRLGRGVGGLYFSNTLGAILGSLIAGFVLLPILGAKAALIATGAFSALLGLTVHLGSKRRGAIEPWIALLAVVVLLGLAPVLRGAGRMLLSDTQDAKDTVLFQKEDRAGETRVYRKPATGELHMSVDGHHIGGTETSILRKEKILAHLPMMLAPQTKSTLCVGLGSGITLATFALYDEIEDLSCVEIVPSVIDGARLFREQNRDVLDDARVHVSVGDGVQYLLTTRKRFDVISSDSKLNPEFSGNAPLLSIDYYKLCRDRLTEGGIMVQWLATHLPNSEMEVIARSFIRVFPHAALYWFDPYNVLMAGSKSPIVMDMDAVRGFIGREDRLSQDLKGLLLDNPYVCASLYIADQDRLAAGIPAGPVNSWGRPRLEFTTSKEFRRKPVAYHEDQNLQWMRRLRSVEAQRLRGDYDPRQLESFQLSEGKLLDGFASGAGIERLEPGLADFEEGIALNPADVRLSKYVASIKALASSLENALAEGRVDTPDDLVRLGLARTDAGKIEEGLALFKQAREKKPDDPNIEYNILKALMELERWTEMRPVLAKFKHDYPGDARGYSMQGRLHAAGGELEPARAEFAKAVEIDPQNLVYRNNLATALARMEHYSEAGDEFAAVCDLDPAYQGAAFFAAASYSMAGRNKEAAHWLRFCLEHGLATREQFLESEFFANLRSSGYWEPKLLEGGDEPGAQSRK